MPEPSRSAILRVGLVVNPVAGLGGPGAYKGSDLNWKDALAAGYIPSAPQRATQFVHLVDNAVRWVSVPGILGGDHLPAGCEIIGTDSHLTIGQSTREDTMHAARTIRDAKVDLLCFLGGDGTAADIAHAVGDKQPCLGVPAGVKITSPVYAHDVAEAAWLVTQLRAGFETILRDVTDLDEAAYRTGHVDIELKGNLRVPLSPAIQDGKVATASETPLEPLVEQVLQEWDSDAVTLVGAGSVCQAVKAQFWGKPTLLGVDAIQGSRIIASDLDDRKMAALVKSTREKGGRVRILLSTIGGQGMLLGRGTQMFAPDTLREVGWDNIRVVAPPEKLIGLKGLHIDTGDPELDQAAPKHIRIVTGWNETRLMRILTGTRATPDDVQVGKAGSAQP